MPASLTSGATRRLVSGGGVAFFALVIILAYQVLLPFLLIVWTSLKTGHPGDPGFVQLSFTFSNYVRAFGIQDFWDASFNTVYFALLSSILAFLLGTFLAWVVARTDAPLAPLIGIITMGRIIIPGVIITISWILLASPSIGVLNYLLANATGVPRLLNIYSLWGMVWVQGLEMAPLAYLLMSAAMQASDPRLEEASAIAGAGGWA